MNSDSEIDEISMPSDSFEADKVHSIDSLTEKSKKKYEAVYKSFMEWRDQNNINSYSENVFLTYFEELSTKYKSSSLWTQYSMLRSTLNINNKIKIEPHLKLRAFLKRKSVGYRAKKAKTFTPDEINRFINEAPDIKYLMTKVVLIMGIMGACRANQLQMMSIKDVQDLGSALLVTVPTRKSKIVRKFVITDKFYQVCKKYIDLRSTNTLSSSFFLNYQNGKCTVQNIGKNKLGIMAKQIATFLKLPNPELYMGHSFRKSSGTLIGDAGCNIKAVKRYDTCKSTLAAEENVDASIMNNMDTADIYQSEDSTSTPSIMTKTETFENFPSDVSSSSDTHIENPIKTEPAEESSICSEENDNNADEDSDIDLEDIKLGPENNISSEQLIKENELLKRKVILTEHKERKRLLRLQYDNELKEHEEKMNNIKLQRSYLKQQFESLNQ